MGYHSQSWIRVKALRLPGCYRVLVVYLFASSHKGFIDSIGSDQLNWNFCCISCSSWPIKARVTMLKTNWRNYLSSCSLGQSDPEVDTETGLILSRNSSVRELNSITPSNPIILALNVVDITNSWWQKNTKCVLYMWSGWYRNFSRLFIYWTCD